MNLNNISIRSPASEESQPNQAIVNLATTITNITGVALIALGGLTGSRAFMTGNPLLTTLAAGIALSVPFLAPLSGMCVMMYDIWPRIRIQRLEPAEASLAAPELNPTPPPAAIPQPRRIIRPTPIEENANFENLFASLNQLIATRIQEMNLAYGINGRSLEESLVLWLQEFEMAYPQADYPNLWASHPQWEANLRQHFAPLLTLDSQVAAKLSNYLGRLRETADYQAGGAARQNIILRVARMLQLANSNSAFREELLAIIFEGIENCGDRTILIFNEIEILWNLHQKQLTLQEFQKLAIRAERYRRVQQHAEQVYETFQLHDQIETILYYHLALRNVLNLPITTENMIFSPLADVTSEMLQEACNEILAISDQDLLATSHHWQAYMKRHHGQQVQEITEKYGQLLEDAESYFELETEEEKTTFLQQKLDLAAFFNEATQQSLPLEYVAIANFTAQEREKAIANLLKD